MRFIRKVANYAALVIPSAARPGVRFSASAAAIGCSNRRHPPVLPLRFHGVLQGRPTGGRRRIALPATQCCRAVATLQGSRRCNDVRAGDRRTSGERARCGGATATRRDATCAGGRAAQSATVHNAAKTRGDFGDLRRRRTEVVCRRAARWRPHPRVPGGTCGWVTGMLRRDRPRQREIAPGRWAYPGPAI